MKKGLMIFPRTQVDIQLVNEKLSQKFLLEWDIRLGYFFLEEDEENYDSLEEEIEEELRSSDVNYRIEGVFFN